VLKTFLNKIQENQLTQREERQDIYNG